MSRHTQAQGQQAPKDKIVVTQEGAIKEIRNLRSGRLPVLNVEYIDHLLAAYDAAILENSNMTDSINRIQHEATQQKAEASKANESYMAPEIVLDNAPGV